MCNCVGLKPCQDLLCEVTTLTESVFLHVRTNAGLLDPNRESESEGERILRRARGCPRLIGEIASVARCKGTQWVEVSKESRELQGSNSYAVQWRIFFLRSLWNYQEKSLPWAVDKNLDLQSYISVILLYPLTQYVSVSASFLTLLTPVPQSF